MAFHPTRFWNMIKNATSEDEVWNLLERSNLSSKEESQVVNMFRTSQVVKMRTI